MVGNGDPGLGGPGHRRHCPTQRQDPRHPVQAAHRKIGNKAVQEAHAGLVHYRLNDAAVLPNANYTPNSISLAQSTGVHLLSQFDIPTLHHKLSGYEVKARRKTAILCDSEERLVTPVLDETSATTQSEV